MEFKISWSVNIDHFYNSVRKLESETKQSYACSLFISVKSIPTCIINWQYFFDVNVNGRLNEYSCMHNALTFESSFNLAIYCQLVGVLSQSTHHVVRTTLTNFYYFFMRYEAASVVDQLNNRVRLKKRRLR